MNKLSYFLIVHLLLLIVSSKAVAEEMICFPSPCADFENHVEFSRKNAIGIAIGSFSYEDKVDDLIKVSFSIDKVVKGNFKSNKKVIDFKLIIKDFIVSRQIDNADKDEYKILNEWLSNKKSKISIDEYSSRESLSSKKLLEKGCSSVDVALVDVSVGGLDYKVRESTIPVFEKQKYILFLFRDIPNESTILFPWDLNIYPVDAYESFDE